MEIKKNGKTMSYAVSINSSGQATIPKAVRDLLGVVPGKNRLTFDIVKGKVILGREKSRAEQLDESMEKIWAMLEEAERRNPEITKAKEKYKGMTYDEVMDAYYATEEGKKEFEEEYGYKL
ncbi:hypothetical protein IKE79_00355 [Candidatus Saccharibacteria bacterium]|nr:hypothetical protein [Candidatus Saccharibacteria bacterium]